MPPGPKVRKGSTGALEPITEVPAEVCVVVMRWGGDIVEVMVLNELGFPGQKLEGKTCKFWTANHEQFGK